MSTWSVPRAGGLIAVLHIASCSLLVDTAGLSTDDPATAKKDGGINDANGTPPIGDGAVLIDGAKPQLPPPTAWTRAATSAAPSQRHSARMVYEPLRARTILYGGISVDDRRGDTWLWDGSTWAEQTFPANQSPPGRQGFGFVFDSTRNVVTQFGGQPGPTEVWDLDGANATWTWTKRDTAISSGIPTRIAGVAMAYDPIRKISVAFGGHDNDEALSDTFTWDATTPVKRFRPTPSPPGVRGHGMVFDPFRERVVLFGGLRASNSQHTDEMWLFDGTTWSGPSAAPSGTDGPGARSPGCMAYDKDRRLLVIFGGRRGDEFLSDTWLYDGTRWTRGPDGPPARRSCAIAYDEANQTTVMFGGTLDDRRRGGDDTWLLK